MDRLVCDAELRYEVQNDWYVFPPTHTQTHQVAIPLPRPIGYETADEYKIMLSFDRTCGIRVHVISWQRIMPAVGWPPYVGQQTHRHTPTYTQMTDT